MGSKNTGGAIWLSIAFLFTACCDKPALARDGMNSDEIDSGVVRSAEVSTRNSSSFGTLRSAAEYYLRQGQLDKAIKCCKQALAESPKADLDLHAIYAEALEKKIPKVSEELRPQFQSDSVGEWLKVLRNEAGEEAGTTFHGIGLPLVGHFYEDEERHIEAKTHLVKLAGRVPHGWETDSKYLRSVMKAKPEVFGKLVTAAK